MSTDNRPGADGAPELRNNRVLTVVIPAYNEERLLPSTLDSVARACRLLPIGWISEIVVVDDISQDATGAIARNFGAKVVTGQRRGIGAARNAGAAASQGQLIAFIDADTCIPETALSEVVRIYENNDVRAVAIPGRYETNRLLLKPLLAWWKRFAPRNNSTQGVFQCFDRDLFDQLNGYDEDLFMAEDTDLFDRALLCIGEDQWRIMSSISVTTSMRRYEQSSIVALWLFTNPISTRYLRRVQPIWRHWYKSPPR